MKTFLLVFTLTNFICSQVLASSCAVMCDYNEELKKVTRTSSQPNKQANSPRKANHECCHGNKTNEENSNNDKPFQCMGELGGACFHEVTAKETALKLDITNLISTVLPPSKAFFYSPLILHFPPRNSSVPGVAYGGVLYLKHKEGLALHILKDQFLI